MDHYLDIRILEDPEFSSHLLMGALVGKLHRTLFDLDAEDIGVSFPEHRVGINKRTMGNLLRVHGIDDRLDQLFNSSWLTGMRDHIALGAVDVVPEQAKHRIVSRRQFNTGSPSRARRLAKRHGLELAEAQRRLDECTSRKIELPFVSLNSRSTAQRFALFIEHGALQSQAVSGHFNHYGLSSNATIPWF
ncbi:CRISPR-associated endonuclease Cas6f/Csy4 [Carnimonas sp. R-84981]|uniref:type I-F CRISPR-associated endoribonuclease Cas6/Csy4 n=1 Tax=Carnimonas bestiolae TaxID=3402172 RepID=UPI003EDC8EF6